MIAAFGLGLFLSIFGSFPVKFEGKSAQATLPIINKSKWSNLKINLPQNIIKHKEIVGPIRRKLQEQFQVGIWV